MTVEEASRLAIERVLASDPWLVGVRPAEVVPGMRPDLILHAAPPASWDELSPVLRAGLLGAARFEGLAHHACRTAVSRSTGLTLPTGSVVFCWEAMRNRNEARRVSGYRFRHG